MFHFKRFIQVTFIVFCLLAPAVVFAQGPNDTIDKGPADTTQVTNNTVWSNIVHSPGIRTVWKLSLGIIDFIVVAGLIVAAFANIFHLKIDTYAIKQILPGIIIGIILANLSYFIMNLFIEVSSVITQFIGTIVSDGNYLGGSIGNDYVGAYIVKRVATLVFLSVTTNPFGIDINYVDAGTNLLAPIAIGLEAIEDVGVTIFSMVLFFILILAVLVILLIVVFLFFIRHYVLIFMFMIAPLAFFSLGFPPFKKWWTMWWSNFWKWLIMAPIMILLVAFAGIFLNNVNASGLSGRSIGDYFFVNGIALIILYSAWRIPFQLGSLFGQDVMGKWSKFGKYSARQGPKNIYDAGGKAVATLQTRRMGLTQLTGKSTHADAVAEAQRTIPVRPGESTSAWEARALGEMRDQERNKRSRSYAMQNPVRQIQGIRNVAKNIEEARDKEDARLTRRSRAYQEGSKRFTPGTFTSEQLERFKSEYGDNLDAKTLYSDAQGLRTYLLGEGFTNDQAAEQIKKLVSTSSDNMYVALQTVPSLANRAGDPDLYKQIMAFKQLRLALNQQLRSGRGRIIFEEAIRGVTTGLPYVGRTSKANTKSQSANNTSTANVNTGSGSPPMQGGGATDAYLTAEQGGSPPNNPPATGAAPYASRLQTEPVVQDTTLGPVQQQWAAREGQEAASPEESSSGTESPTTGQPTPTSAARPAQGGTTNPGIVGMPLYETLVAAVGTGLDQYGASFARDARKKKQLNNLINVVRSRMDQGQGNMGSKDLAGTGISSQEWKQIAPRLSPYIQERKRIMASADSGEMLGAERFGELTKAQNLATQLAATSAQNSAALRQEVGGYLNQLSSGATEEQVSQIQANMASITGKSAQSVEELTSEVKNHFNAFSLLSEDTMRNAAAGNQDMNEALKQTLRVRTLKENTIQDAVKQIVSVQQQTGATNAQLPEIAINPQVQSNISGNIHSVIDFNPQMRESMANLLQEQQDAVVNQSTSAFAARLAQQGVQVSEGQLEQAFDLPAVKDQLSHDLSGIIQDQINTVSANPEQVQIAQSPPSQAETPSFGPQGEVSAPIAPVVPPAAEGVIDAVQPPPTE
jgi:hypothetical protein